MPPSTKEINTLDFDRILKHVGPLGLWQFWHLLMLFFVTLIGGIAATTFAFTGKILCILECRYKIIATYSNSSCGVSSLGKPNE